MRAQRKPRGKGTRAADGGFGQREHAEAAGGHADEGGLGLERIVFFSDAVFAIAITLLVLEIRLPELTPEAQRTLDSAELTRMLLEPVPRYIGFLVSFVVIGLYWAAHHRDFRYIKRYDNGLIYINLFLLMFVVFTPFPTAVLGAYVNLQSAVVFYAIVMILVGLLHLWLWYYATHNHRLVDERLDPDLIRYRIIRSTITPLVFLLSIGISFYSPLWAVTSWLIMIPCLLLVDRYYRGQF